VSTQIFFIAGSGVTRVGTTEKPPEEKRASVERTRGEPQRLVYSTDGDSVLRKKVHARLSASGYRVVPPGIVDCELPESECRRAVRHAADPPLSPTRRATIERRLHDAVFNVEPVAGEEPLVPDGGDVQEHVLDELERVRGLLDTAPERVWFHALQDRVLDGLGIEERTIDSPEKYERVYGEPAPDGYFDQ